MKLPRFRLVGLFIAVAAIALPLGWLQVGRLSLRRQLAQLESEGCKVSYQDNGLWITAPQVEVALGYDQVGGMSIGAESVSLEEAGERLSALHNRLRLLAVADKTIRIVTTDERTGQKSETTSYVGEGDGPVQMYFQGTQPSAGASSTGRRRAPRKQAAAAEAPSSAETN